MIPSADEETCDATPSRSLVSLRDPPVLYSRGYTDTAKVLRVQKCRAFRVSSGSKVQIDGWRIGAGWT